MEDLFINTIAMLGDGIKDQQLFLEKLAQLKPPIKGVEVRKEFFAPEPKKREGELLAILETGKQNGWEIRYSIPEPLFTAEGLNPDFAQWKKEAELLQAVSVKMNIGDLTGIAQVTKEQLMPLPFQLTIENDQTPENGYLDPVLRALKRIEEQALPIGYTFDLGNWAVMGEDAAESFAKTKERITIFHLKNVDEQQRTTLLDEGIFDWRHFLTGSWPVGIEYPMHLTEVNSEAEKAKEAIQNGESRNDR